MPTYFCPADRCGYAITYATTKPAACPKCATVFAKVGVIPSPVSVKATKPKAIALVTVNDDDDTDPPPSPRRNMRPARAKAHRVIEADDDGEGQSSRPSSQSSVYDPDDDVYDPREARRLKREMIASIDPSSFRILGLDEDNQDTKVRFGDIVLKQGQF